MAAHEEIRASLYRKLHELVGREEAAALMPPIAWEQVATKADLAELRGELLEKIGALDAKIGALEGTFGTLAWKIVAANIASSAAVAGAVVAAIRL